MYRDAVLRIQRWYRDVKVTMRKAFRTLVSAMDMCLQRRYAINHAVKYEMYRRGAMEKMRKGIAQRRRWYFGVRATGRTYRWMLLYRKTRWRLTRQHFARVLQRWRRMVLMRHPNDLTMIKYILFLGGYTVVRRKVAERHIVRGFLNSLHSCVSMIQKAYYQSKGRMEVYMKAAAERARAAYEAMLNENAIIIQNSYEAHIWDNLILAAVINNRVRRLSKSFRAYQWRKPLFYQARRLLERTAPIIQRFVRFRLWKSFLLYRFKARKAVIIFTRAKVSMACMMIQYVYRLHVAYEFWKKEELKEFYAKQRANVRVKLRKVSTIQRAYRRIMLNTFPEHAKIASVRIVARRRNKEYMLVCRIQKLAHVWIAKQRIVDEHRRVQSANVIWMFTKAYLLKLKLYDLVYETRIRKNNAANHLKRYFRRQVLIRWIDMKCSVRRAVKFTLVLREHAASFIQKRIFRKRWENQLPLRVAGRLQLKRARQQEYVEWVWHMRDRNARVLQKFMVNIVRWEKFVRRVALEKRHFLEINSARRLCIFGGKVIKTARFRDYLLRKLKHIADEEVLRNEMWAANRIGRNWKRKMQMALLRERFVLRRKTLGTRFWRHQQLHTWMSLAYSTYSWP